MYDMQLVSFVQSKLNNNDDIRSTAIVFTCSWYLSLTVKIHRKIYRISFAKNDIVCLEEIIIIAIYQLFFELEHVDFCVYFDFFAILQYTPAIQYFALDTTNYNP